MRDAHLYQAYLPYLIVEYCTCYSTIIKPFFFFYCNSKLLWTHAFMTMVFVQQNSSTILMSKSEIPLAECACVAMFRETQGLVGGWRCSVQPPLSEDSSRYRSSREILTTWVQQKSLSGEKELDIITGNIQIITSNLYQSYILKNE